MLLVNKRLMEEITVPSGGKGASPRTSATLSLQDKRQKKAYHQHDLGYAKVENLPAHRVRPRAPPQQLPNRPARHRQSPDQEASARGKSQQPRGRRGRRTREEARPLRHTKPGEAPTQASTAAEHPTQIPPPIITSRSPWSSCQRRGREASDHGEGRHIRSRLGEERGRKGAGVEGEGAGGAIDFESRSSRSGSGRSKHYVKKLALVTGIDRLW
jgi:hypothetical protein